MAMSKPKGSTGQIQHVYAGVHSSRSARSHELFIVGAKVIEMNCQNESLLLNIAKNAKGVVVIPPYENRPDWDRKLMTGLSYLKKANPSVAVMISEAGVSAADNIEEEPNQQQFKYLAKFESEFKELGKDKQWSILRKTPPQEFLLHYSNLVQDTGMLMLPIGDGKCPFVSMKDIGVAVMHLIQNPKKSDKSGNVYTLTGPEALSGQKLVERLNKEAQIKSGEGQLSFKDVKPLYAERYLRIEFPQKASALVHFYLGNFELIKQSKLEKTTDDFKKITGEQPRQVDELIKDFAQLFQP
jgi:hypothetical protein